jgi:hypothetical protein
MKKINHKDTKTRSLMVKPIFSLCLGVFVVDFWFLDVYKEFIRAMR